MRVLFPVRLMGLKLYIQCFLVELIFGQLFRKQKNCDDKCEICGKPLKNKRYEITCQRPEYNYEFEFDKILCINHAIQYLVSKREREEGL